MDYKDYIKNLNIFVLNKMQNQAIDAIGKNPETIILSPTGSGKTLAFLLPLISLINKNLEQIQVLILTPTRELTIQVEKVFKQLKTNHKINACYGGHSIKIEQNNFSTPPMVLVGTPGRINDHINRRNFNPNFIKVLVVDEFDKCLEFGFQDEMERIIRKLDVKKTILTSATDLDFIPSFIQVSNPVTIDCLEYIEDINKKTNLTLNAVYSAERDKLNTLYDLLLEIGNEPTLVFCNRKDAVERVFDFLESKNIISDTFHGDLTQVDREKSLIKFRNESVNILICTDLASRGLDIENIKNVVHYHLPLQQDIFVHRNGRTARMQKNGSAYLIFAPDERIAFENPFKISTYEFSNNTKYQHPSFGTLYIGKGKKDKINKIDIVGFFYKQIKLKKEDLGLIDVQDFCSYAAINRKIIDTVCKNANRQKIKNRTVKVELAK